RRAFRSRLRPRAGPPLADGIPEADWERTPRGDPGVEAPRGRPPLPPRPLPPRGGGELAGPLGPDPHGPRSVRGGRQRLPRGRERAPDRVPNPPDPPRDRHRA